jgi:hypothetical protein
MKIEPWDPNKLGPMDRCLRCFTPHEENCGICPTCGNIEPIQFYDTFSMKSTIKCIKHPKRQAIGYCALCYKPFCRECILRIGHSFTVEIPYYYCSDCCNKYEKIEKEFFLNLEKKGVCAKHRGLKAEYKCIWCKLPLCESCAYFKVAGIWNKIKGEGPYCLTCFRWATCLKGRDQWFSGGEFHSK